MNIISRSEAKSLGLARYFTGRSCSNGHVSERKTRSGQCLTCCAQWSKRYRDSNVDKVKASRSDHNSRNAASIAAYNRRYKDENKQVLRARWLSRFEQNADAFRERARARHHENRAVNLERMRRYRAERQHVRTALQALRKSRLRLAVPKWFGELDALVWLEAADLVRRRSVSTGIPWHADHMIPVACKVASGLHVWNNCQVIPAALNNSKKNQLVLTQPGEWVIYMHQNF